MSGESIRALELFSGIGGMRYAAERALSSIGGGIAVDNYYSVEINPSAAEVYALNFKEKFVTRNVKGLKSREAENYDLLLMSPPCQPFTRTGLKLDISDERTEPFVEILRLLPQLPRLRAILLENVYGFESSVARDLLLKTLSPSWKFREFLLCPTQFGIPNSRLRYYFIALKTTQDFPFGVAQKIIRDPQEFIPNFSFSKSTLANYIHNESLDLNQYILKDKIIGKYAEILDIVSPDSEKSCCFTKSYGRYAEGTGSVLAVKSLDQIKTVYAESRKSSDPISVIRKLELRYFTPDEISSLMGFPTDKNEFSFPSSTSVSSRYKLLGNSLNVTVVSKLLEVLFRQMIKSST